MGEHGTETALEDREDCVVSEGGWDALAEGRCVLATKPLPSSPFGETLTNREQLLTNSNIFKLRARDLAWCECLDTRNPVAE